jgi:hypothetical protein
MFVIPAPDIQPRSIFKLPQVITNETIRKSLQQHVKGHNFLYVLLKTFVKLMHSCTFTIHLNCIMP